MVVKPECLSVQETGRCRSSALRALDARWDQGNSNLLSRVPDDWILFGFYFPFFILDAEVPKLRQSELIPAQVKSIPRENAERQLRGL